MILQGFPGYLFFRGYKMATSAYFFVAIISCGDYIKLIGYFALLVWVQMAVGLHGGLHPFVSQAFCYQKRRTAHVNQRTGVGMTHIVHPDLLRSGVVTARLHLSADPSPVIREDAVCRLYIVKLCQIVFQTVFQYIRYDNLTVASFCLRRIDIVLSVQTLVTAAQKYVVQEKQEGKLKKLLKEAKKTIADMKAKIESLVAELTAVKEELSQYKSVRGQLRTADLEQENDRLYKRIRTYEDVISRNNLWSYFSKRKARTTEKDTVK